MVVLLRILCLAWYTSHPRYTISASILTITWCFRVHLMSADVAFGKKIFIRVCSWKFLKCQIPSVLIRFAFRHVIICTGRTLCDQICWFTLELPTSVRSFAAGERDCAIGSHFEKWPDPIATLLIHMFLGACSRPFTVVRCGRERGLRSPCKSGI